jgi:hypothetical protein
LEEEIMKKSIIYIILVLAIFMIATCLPGAYAEYDEKEDKDTDKDGIPDKYDSEKNGTSVNDTNKTTKTQLKGTTKSTRGAWSFAYGSDTQYGAWIGDVRWNLNYYIYIANVPWIEIDGIKYEIPNDFTTVEVGFSDLNNYYLVYHFYSIVINEVTHDLEILWEFMKAPNNGAGEIRMKAVLSAMDSGQHAIFVPFRIDFDIIGASNDRHFAYGSTNWALQTGESPQFTYNPVDPTWGMKVKQVEYSSDAWGGIKAWSTLEMNYLLRWHFGEERGHPANYINGENTDRQDDLIWTTASTSGTFPLQCGPTAFVK